MWQPPYFPSPKASSRASNGTGTWHAARHTTIQVHTPVHHSKRASSNATSAQLPLNKVTSPMQAIAWVTGDRYTGKEYISGAQKWKLWSEARTKEQGHLKVAERQKALKLGNCCGQVTHLCKGSTCDGINMADALQSTHGSFEAWTRGKDHAWGTRQWRRRRRAWPGVTKQAELSL